jgi:hypothetical protein
MIEHENPYQSPATPSEPPRRARASWLWNLMLPAIMLPLGYIGIEIGIRRGDPQYLRMAWIFGFQCAGIVAWAIAYRVMHSAPDDSDSVKATSR